MMAIYLLVQMDGLRFALHLYKLFELWLHFDLFIDLELEIVVYAHLYLLYSGICLLALIPFLFFLIQFCQSLFLIQLSDFLPFWLLLLLFLSIQFLDLSLRLLPSWFLFILVDLVILFGPLSDLLPPYQHQPLLFFSFLVLFLTVKHCPSALLLHPTFKYALSSSKKFEGFFKNVTLFYATIGSIQQNNQLKNGLFKGLEFLTLVIQCLNHLLTSLFNFDPVHHQKKLTFLNVHKAKPASFLWQQKKLVERLTYLLFRFILSDDSVFFETKIDSLTCIHHLIGRLRDVIIYIIRRIDINDVSFEVSYWVEHPFGRWRLLWGRLGAKIPSFHQLQQRFIKGFLMIFINTCQ